MPILTVRLVRARTHVQVLVVAFAMLASTACAGAPTEVTASCDVTIAGGESIGSAVAAAEPGHVICLDEGIYNEAVEITRLDNLTLLGMPGAVLTGEGLANGARPVYISGVGRATVQGLTIQGFDGDFLCSGGTECDLRDTFVDGNVQAEEGGVLTIIGTEVHGNLHAAEGSWASVVTAMIKGNIQVEGNALLIVEDGNIDGNVQADGASNVAVLNSTVRGNVQAEDGASVAVEGSDIGGNVQLNGNDVISVLDNTIGGNLQCRGNDESEGGGNTVVGNMEDQCAAF